MDSNVPIEETIGELPVIRELGITLVRYSPLGRGLVTNQLDVRNLPDDNFRKRLPRYSGNQLDNNQKIAIGLAEIAANRNANSTQLALAWILAQGEYIIPIPGTKRKNYLNENSESVNIHLSIEDLNRIDVLLKMHTDVGLRYFERFLGFVNR